MTPHSLNLSPPPTVIPRNIISLSIWLLFMPEEEFSDGWTVGWEKWLFQVFKYFCFLELRERERERIAASQEQRKSTWQTNGLIHPASFNYNQATSFLWSGKTCVLHKIKRWEGVGNYPENSFLYSYAFNTLWVLSSVDFSRNDIS